MTSIAGDRPTPRLVIVAGIAQLGVILSVLIACSFMPTREGSSLLLAVPGLERRDALEFARSRHFPLIGPGAIAGSYVSIGIGPGDIVDGLMHGIVIIAVPGKLCGSSA